jgi:hypothetical protein
MNIPDHARQRIAARLAASLPTWADREGTAAAAGLSDVQLTGEGAVPWRLLVDEAVAQDKLVRLVRAASRRKPDDAGLARLATDLEAGRLPGMALSGLVLPLGVGVVVLAIGAWWMTAPGGEAVVAEPPSVATPSPAAVVQSPPPTPVEEPPAPVPVPVPVVAPAPTPTPTPTPTATPTPAAASTTPTGTGPCAGRRGYAYLGASTSLRAGATWTVASSINVRATYPTRDNSWDARSALQCTLPAGSVVEVREAPIEVSKGAWWVLVDGAAVRSW